MNLSAPKKFTFWIAVLLAVLGIVFGLLKDAGLHSAAIWVVVAAFVVLALGNLIEGF